VVSKCDKGSSERTNDLLRLLTDRMPSEDYSASALVRIRRFWDVHVQAMVAAIVPSKSRP